MCVIVCVRMIVRMRVSASRENIYVWVVFQRFEFGLIPLPSSQLSQSSCTPPSTCPDQNLTPFTQGPCVPLGQHSQGSWQPWHRLQVLLSTVIGDAVHLKSSRVPLTERRVFAKEEDESFSTARGGGCCFLPKVTSSNLFFESYGCSPSFKI